jgi:hypothetical protein
MVERKKIKLEKKYSLEVISEGCYSHFMDLAAKEQDPDIIFGNLVQGYICAVDIGNEQVRKITFQAMLEAANEVVDPAQLKGAAALLSAYDLNSEADAVEKIIKNRFGDIKFTFEEIDDDVFRLVVDK